MTTATDFEHLLDQFETAGRAWAQAVWHESDLEDHRQTAKREAVVRLLGTTNPETGKDHSASSAEKCVENDGPYADYLSQLRDAVLTKNMAWVQMKSAAYRVELALAVTREGVA